MSRICYVTGVPGIGKTTLCETLVKRSPTQYRHLDFGQMIRSVVANQEHRDVSEQELREAATHLITPDVLKSATSLLLRKVSCHGERDWVLVDSHAASQDWYGFIATPDGATYFSALKYAAIVHLFASPKKVFARSNSAQSGRRAARTDDLTTHEALLRSVTILYSSISNCPAYFVQADASAGEVANRVDRLLMPET